MKHRGIIMAVIVVIAVVVIYFLPGEKTFQEIAVVGKQVPNFTLKDAGGNVWNLSDLRGKVVFINFWATWCTTCKAEMKDKAILSEKMQGRPFQMLGVLFRDDPANLKDYVKKINVSSPTLIDPGNSLARLYGITGVPETFILDKEGKLRQRLVGPKEWGSPEMIALMEELL
jgi:peroxiredoxin